MSNIVELQSYIKKKDELAAVLQQFHDRKQKVYLRGIGTSCFIGTNDPNKTLFPWSDMNGMFYQTASDLVFDRNGMRRH